MRYDIKRGWYKNIEGDGLKRIMEDMFGNVSEEDGMLVSSYGVMARIMVGTVSKEVLEISTENHTGRQFADEEILDSKRKLNAFAEKATGFDAKARMKRAKDKAKKGEL